MKYSFLTLFVILFIAVSVRAQDDAKMQPPFKRIENLEKVKLIEALKLNEETSVRFFARRGDFKKKVRQYDKQSNEVLAKIRKLIDEKSDKNGNELKKLSDEYLKLQNQIPKEKASFMCSLSDILTSEQIARLLVFEKDFREELKNLVFKERSPDRK
jgi:hypothetical protein